MKKVLFLVMWSVCSWVNIQAQHRSPGSGYVENQRSKYAALLVGVNSYTYLPPNEQLNYPVEEASRFQELLHRYNFQPSNILLLKDPTGHEFWEGVEKTKAKVQEVDQLLVFISLHGKQLMTNGQYQYYLLPKDAKPEQSSSWIAASDLINRLKSFRYKQLLIILDACYGGRIFNTPVFSGIRVTTRGGGSGGSVNVVPSANQIQTLLGMNSSMAITSGTESQKVPDHSVFFQALQQTLNANNDQYLLASSLFNTVKTLVMRLPGTIPQHEKLPQLRHEPGGDFIFYKPTGIEPPNPLPTIESPSKTEVEVEQTIIKTKIRVQRGQTIQINAEGTIKVGTWVGTVNPAGKENLDNLPFRIDVNTYNVAPQYPHGALLFRIAPETKWRYCGEQCSFKAITSGELTVEFIVNDKDRTNNVGQFSVTIAPQ